ncbi:hypothetical protein DMUE_5884 [Dictyocoela muelleri]|nr:hypothetical protein DMUE_5884 [Dictyocoela muelleri]
MFNAIISILSRYNIFLARVKILIDFEVATFIAIQRCFSNTEVSGCLFHFGQALWRKKTKLGLSARYNVYADFRESVEFVTALALIPVESIDEGWNYIQS